MPNERVNNIDIHFEDLDSGRPVLFIYGGFGGAQRSLLPGPKTVAQNSPTGFG